MSAKQGLTGKPSRLKTSNLYASDLYTNAASVLVTDEYTQNAAQATESPSIYDGLPTFIEMLRQTYCDPVFDPQNPMGQFAAFQQFWEALCTDGRILAPSPFCRSVPNGFHDIAGGTIDDWANAFVPLFNGIAPDSQLKNSLSELIGTAYSWAPPQDGNIYNHTQFVLSEGDGQVLFSVRALKVDSAIQLYQGQIALTETMWNEYADYIMDNPKVDLQQFVTNLTTPAKS